MSRDNLKHQVQALNELIRRGATLEAMERFYAEDVEMQENEEAPRIGKAICLEHERKNLDNVLEVVGRLSSQAINFDSQVVMSEWRFIFSNKKEQMFELSQVSVQHWRDQKIYREKFYYQKIIQL